MRIGWILTVLCLVTACANENDKCGNTVLTLTPESGGGYAFTETKLTTLSNPYVLDGGAAKIYYESAIDANGYQGSVANPRYTRSGDVCVPMDAASSMAVSVYAQFEKIMKFEAEIGTLDMLSWPRKVGLDIHVNATDGSTHNNAHYISKGDSIAILPYDLKGVPLALNPGVLAHEHFHGHFQRQVIAETNARLSAVPTWERVFYLGFGLTKPTVEEVTAGELHTPRGMNAFVLRAWNEGLADVYGWLYTQDPQFFTISLPKMEGSRALTADPQPFINRDHFEFIALQATSAEDLVGLSYGQGAYLARLMYRLAIAGGETREEFLVHMLRRLRDIPPAIAANYDRRVLEIESVLPILLRDLPLNDERCDQLIRVVSPDLMQRSFATCLNPAP